MSVAHVPSGIETDSEGRHLHRLERALSVALSPLDFSDATAWGDALTTALCQLAESNAGAILLPAAAPRWRAVTRDRSTDDYAAAWGVHEEGTERLHQPTMENLVHWVRDDLSGHDQLSTIAPSAGTIGFRVRTSSGAVGVVCVRRDRALATPSARLLAALRAVAPAFRAGVGSWVGAITRRSNVVRMLDSLADPTLLFDLRGQLVHSNPAAERLTPSADASRLRSEAQCIAWTLGATARRCAAVRIGASGGIVESADAGSARSVRSGAAFYRLRGSIIGEQLLGNEPGVLVTMTVATPKPLSDDALRTGYGLTAREIQVARLIAEGLSNNEIGDRLGIRFFTARNHVERTLAKLGVATRHRVGPLLRNESDPTEANRASAA